MVLITILFYHISNINGLFENYSDERRKKYLNLALAKFEYSFLEYYGHHLYYIFHIDSMEILFWKGPFCRLYMRHSLWNDLN